jgi:hypothetical protein
MSWLERFRKIRELADKQEAEQRKRVSEERKREHNILDERRKTVKKNAPKIERTCKQFSRGVKGKMVKYKSSEWRKLNFGWNLQADFGGIRVRAWPWLREAQKPKQLRGVWMQYLSPRGLSTVDAKKTRGVELKGKSGPTSSGYYYWPLSYNENYCTFGYFLALDDFSPEKMSRALEKVGHDLLTFSWEDTPTASTEAIMS